MPAHSDIRSTCLGIPERAGKSSPRSAQICTACAAPRPVSGRRCGHHPAAWMIFHPTRRVSIIHDHKRPWRITGNASSSVYRLSWAHTLTCWRIFASTSPESGHSSATSRPTRQIFLQQAGQAVVLARRLVSQFRTHWDTPLADQLLARARSAGRCTHRDFSRRMQPRMPWASRRTSGFACFQPGHPGGQGMGHWHE